MGFGTVTGSPEFQRKLASLVFWALQLADVKAVVLRGSAGLSSRLLDPSTPEGQELTR